MKHIIEAELQKAQAQLERTKQAAVEAAQQATALQNQAIFLQGVVGGFQQALAQAKAEEASRDAEPKTGDIVELPDGRTGEVVGYDPAE